MLGIKYNFYLNKMNSRILSLDLTKFNLDQDKFKIPFLHETWTWEGDESILPYKWVNIIKQSQIIQMADEGSFNQVKEQLKLNYYGKPNFDKKSFFFITYRSEVAASAYLNVNNNNTIEYFAINPKYLGKGVNNGLFYLIYNRAKDLNITELKVDTKLTNEKTEFFLGIGFA